MCWKPLYANNNKQCNKTCVLLHTTGGKDEPNIVYMRNLYEEEFEDTKGAIRIRISKKNRHYNGQKKKYKRTNNDLLNIHMMIWISNNRVVCRVLGKRDTCRSRPHRVHCTNYTFQVTSFVSYCGGIPAPECSDTPMVYKFRWVLSKLIFTTFVD
jgi:hypothetical protein